MVCESQVRVIIIFLFINYNLKKNKRIYNERVLEIEHGTLYFLFINYNLKKQHENATNEWWKLNTVHLPHSFSVRIEGMGKECTRYVSALAKNWRIGEDYSVAMS